MHPKRVLVRDAGDTVDRGTRHHVARLRGVALLAIEELGGTDPRVIVAVNTITVTIVFSVIAHGITARPLATRYLAGLNSAQRTSVDVPASQPDR